MVIGNGAPSLGVNPERSQSIGMRSDKPAPGGPAILSRRSPGVKELVVLFRDSGVIRDREARPIFQQEG